MSKNEREGEEEKEWREEICGRYSIERGGQRKGKGGKDENLTDSQP